MSFHRFWGLLYSECYNVFRFLLYFCFGLNFIIINSISNELVLLKRIHERNMVDTVNMSVTVIFLKLSSLIRLFTKSGHECNFSKFGHFSICSIRIKYLDIL
jgi:hypothetical protein